MISSIFLFWLSLNLSFMVSSTLSILVSAKKPAIALNHGLRLLAEDTRKLGITHVDSSNLTFLTLFENSLNFLRIHLISDKTSLISTMSVGATSSSHYPWLFNLAVNTRGNLRTRSLIVRATSSWLLWLLKLLLLISKLVIVLLKKSYSFAFHCQCYLVLEFG